MDHVIVMGYKTPAEIASHPSATVSIIVMAISISATVSHNLFLISCYAMRAGKKAAPLQM